MIKYSDTSRNITVDSNQHFNNTLAYHSIYIFSGNSKYYFSFVSFSISGIFLCPHATSHTVTFTFKTERMAVQFCKIKLHNQERILSFEGGSSRSHYVEELF
jgi:hypothetical protein